MNATQLTAFTQRVVAANNWQRSPQPDASAAEGHWVVHCSTARNNLE